jgi:hypothetical protein
MTRRDPQDEPAAVLAWRGWSPTARLIWSTAALTVAVVLFVVTWPRDVFPKLALLTLVAGWSSQGAIRAWSERRATRPRQGSGPANGDLT